MLCIRVLGAGDTYQSVSRTPVRKQSDTVAYGALSASSSRQLPRASRWATAALRPDHYRPTWPAFYSVQTPFSAPSHRVQCSGTTFTPSWVVQNTQKHSKTALFGGVGGSQGSAKALFQCDSAPESLFSLMQVSLAEEGQRPPRGRQRAAQQA